jgi:hypothetical protein
MQEVKQVIFREECQEGDGNKEIIRRTKSHIPQYRYLVQDMVFAVSIM